MSPLFHYRYCLCLRNSKNDFIVTYLFLIIITGIYIINTMIKVQCVHIPCRMICIFDSKLKCDYQSSTCFLY